MTSLETKTQKLSKDKKTAINQGFNTNIEYRNHCAQKNGFMDYYDYKNYLAQKNGFKDFNEYLNIRKHRHPKNTNKKTKEVDRSWAVKLGTLSEKVLTKVFFNVTRMPYANSGYDFICSKGNKIEVKSSTLLNNNNRIYYLFTINKNKIADYFLLLAFNNKNELNPEHLFLIKGNEIIREKPLNTFKALVITNPIEFSKYEQKNKLEKTILYCNSIKRD